jgi:hypothetical protein
VEQIAPPTFELVNERLFQEAREFLRRGRVTLRVLQLREVQQRYSLYACDGRRRLQFRVDGARFSGDDRSVSERIENIRQAVEVMHECKATHERSVPVKEMFGPQTTWEGVVESFVLTGHPKAQRCYAWSFEDDAGNPRYVAVLELPPVESPNTAVRAAIASGQQK